MRTIFFFLHLGERTNVCGSTRFVIVPSAEEGDDEELAQQSDVEYNRRSGPRRKKRQRWRGNGNGNGNGNGSGGGNGILSRRRARSSASGVGNYVDSEEEEEQEVKGGDGGRRRGAVRRGRGAVGGRRRAGGRGGGISEVTFFTHLKFSAYLPDFQEMEACRHFVGPLHILQVRRGGAVVVVLVGVADLLSFCVCVS